ncbi:feruloyl esterase A [Spatholobus suberectus]|nr:feruloyl esterase A [Spatholobus suberectus]
MASLQFRYVLSPLSPKPPLPHPVGPRLYRTFPPHFPGKLRVFSLAGKRRVLSICCSSKTGSQLQRVAVPEDDERPPFDINLAVILAGFAFEAYTTPPENMGRREVDAAGCKTVYLSEEFVHEIYDGQLFIKLKKGFNFPAMDPWGTSDPYVVIQIDSQTAKSNIKWGTKEPTWNEEFTFNIKQPPSQPLQVAAWDANLVTPHKRMGNAGVDLEWLCDGDVHEILVELEGMGGGGKVQLEVKYKTYDEIDEEKRWWKIPFVLDFLKIKGFDSAFRKVIGSDTVQARQFVEYAFGQLKSFNNSYLLKGHMSDINNDKYDTEGIGELNESASMFNIPSNKAGSSEASNEACSEQRNSKEFHKRDSDTENGYGSELSTEVSEEEMSNQIFWRNFTNVINSNIGQKLGLSVPEKFKWDGLEFLNKIGSQSQNIAESIYVQSGLAMPGGTDDTNDKTSGRPAIAAIQSSLPEVKKATQNLMRQTESILGGLMLLTATVSKIKDEGHSSEERKIKEDSTKAGGNGLVLDDKKTKEMKALFSTAESAVEAWAMLATSLGQPSFIKSEFEKICFLDNASTDTQVAIWRDSARRRLVVAFRGTEQSQWKDLRTDLMLVPAGVTFIHLLLTVPLLLQVHSGFLSAYDSVRTRIISLIQLAIGYVDDHSESLHKWHVYVTGHSLGGALATLLALELSSNQLAKRGAISITMYNFGSPRVGNKRFAEVYNERVKDSWRVVNHRDIIPTVPRLMGYCHVERPVFLAAGVLRNALENKDILGDGYEGDVLGESTPDVIVSEFLKGEKELIEKLLQTEINIFRSIRDGTALMQHMEDFYYITLLENVRSNYQAVPRSEQDQNYSL